MAMSRRRFWVAVATVVVATLTARLGVWQLDRAATKQAWVDAVAAQQSKPPLDASAWQNGAPGETELHRHVRLQGHWRGEFTRYLDNRTMGEATGFLVVTPLRLDNGQTVVVQRGWVPRNRVDRTQLAPVQTPAGEVTVEGILAAPPSRYFSLGDDGTGPVLQNLNWAKYGQDMHADIGTMSVREDGTASDGLQRHWNPINTKISTHYGYAFQWFAMAFATVILYVWYQIIIPRRRRS